MPAAIDRQLSDAELVRRARNGTTGAFDILVERHYRAIYGVAYAWMGNSQDAEDVAQEAFCVAFERLRSLREPAAFTGWLRRITRNRCHMERRSGPDIVSMDDLSAIGDLQLASSMCPVEELEGQQRQTAVRAVLTQLPEAMARTATLFYLEGLFLKQIGASLGVPVSTVKVRLFRARELIRQNNLSLLRGVYTPTREKSVSIRPAEGFLRIHADGYGFLRPSGGDGPATTDVYVSASQIHRFDLAEGSRILGHARPPKGGESFDALLRIDSVDGVPREPETRPATGFLHMDDRGWGFLRPSVDSSGSREDVYVSARQIGTGPLRAGDCIKGLARPPQGDESYWALIEITRTGNRHM